MNTFENNFSTEISKSERNQVTITLLESESNVRITCKYKDQQPNSFPL